MIYEQTKAACLELIRLERADVRPVRLLVIGASSSEVGGGQIGKASQPQLGGEIARAALDAAREFGVDVAFQCCEHLNRALVVERRVAENTAWSPYAWCPIPRRAARWLPPRTA